MDIGHVIQQRYQLESLLGQGGMGTTYKALDLQTQRLVAVKVLHFSRLQEWKTLELFEREAKILQQLKHPSIPAYIDYFSTETASDVQFVLVQEYIAGKTLRQLVEEGWRGTEAEIVNLLKQLVDILSYLHALRPPVIHRDINPKNILLSPGNKLYLVDFGAVQEQIRRTFLGGSTIIGTFGYIPFEQFSGQTLPASDYYAVGATVLYLLTHRNPDDFPQEQMKIQFQPYLNVSPNLQRVLEGLLEPSSQKRLASPKKIQMLLTKPIQDTQRKERRPIAAPLALEKSDNTVVRKNLNRSVSVPPALEKPYGTRIRNKKIVFQGETHLRFSLPFTIDEGVRLMVGLCGMLAILLSFYSWDIVKGLLRVLAGFMGLGAFWMYLRIKGYIIELTPEYLKLSKKFLGKEYAQSVLPMAVLKPADIQPGMNTITIASEDHPVTIRHSLKKREIDWLMQEMTEYVATYGKKEEPDDHA